MQELYLTNIGKKYRHCCKSITRCCKRFFRKTAEAMGRHIGNKIAEKPMKSKHVTDVNLRNVEEIVIPAIKRQEILKHLGQ